MTKTESAHLTAQTVLLESAEQVLQLQMAAGVRLAIPNTEALIMVGPADWIAKNVPGVEAMVEGERGLFEAWAVGDDGGWMPSALERNPKGDDFDYRHDDVQAEWRAFQAGARLAATTQASTAQAEPRKWHVLSEGDKPDALCLLDVILRNGVCLMDRQYNKIDWTQVRDWRYAATSSTDAQAAAEVRDAALEEAAKLCEREVNCSCCWSDDEVALSAHLAAAIRALRAGDTGGTQ